MYDPLTASGQPYGGIYVDNNDQDSDALNNLLITENLRDIEKSSSDGLYRLNGPWVRIIGSHAPEESDQNSFKYTRNDKRLKPSCHTTSLTKANATYKASTSDIPTFNPSKGRSSRTR